MHFYIDLAHLALALALCGGFFFGRFLQTRKIWKSVEAQAFNHYRAMYNEQMDELCTRYRQERLALIHRYEGLTADLEAEIAVIRNAVDPDRTIRTYVGSNMEAVGLAAYDEEITDLEARGAI